MLVVKIYQGKYYTTMERLFEAKQKGNITVEEHNGLFFFKTLSGQLIHCSAKHNDLIEIHKSIS